MERIHTLYYIEASNVAFRNSKVCWQNYLYKRFGIDKKCCKAKKGIPFQQQTSSSSNSESKNNRKKEPYILYERGHRALSAI